MAHQTAVDIIRVISEAVNPTGQFAYLRTWDASLEFNEVDQKIFLYPISGQVDITNGYFETWTCSMGFFFQDAPDSTNEQREQLITNADVLLKAFILAADTVDGVQFSIVRKRPVYRDMAGTYSGYLVDFTLSLTEDICNGDTPSVIIPVGKTFCELVDECLGISPSGQADYFLNEQGDWMQVQSGGGAVDSVNGQTGAVVLTKGDIGLDNVDNTSDVNKPVSTAQAAADTAVLNASKSYADGLVTGLLDDRGNYDASANLFPSSGGSGVAGAILKGDLWTVNVAGTLGGVSVTNGDVIRALTDIPGQTASNWAVSENNIGYVAENQANKTSTMAGNEASTSIYLSAKGVYDWATSVFTTTSAVALQIATALSGYATQAWVTSQGYITNVISALGFTPENVANKQTDLTASATKYPTVDAVNAGLGNKQDTLVSATNIKTINGSSVLGSGDLVVNASNVLVADYADVAFTASVAAERIIRVLPIPRGTIPINRTLKLNALVTKVGTGSTTTLKIRVATSATPSPVSGATLLANASGMPANQTFLPLSRNNIHTQSATSTISSAVNSLFDLNQSTINGITADWDNVDYWLILTAEHNTTSADAYTSHEFILSL